MLSITAFEPVSNRVNGTLIDHSGVELKLAGWYPKNQMSQPIPLKKQHLKHTHTPCVTLVNFYLT